MSQLCAGVIYRGLCRSARNLQVFLLLICDILHQRWKRKTNKHPVATYLFSSMIAPRMIHLICSVSFTEASCHAEFYFQLLWRSVRSLDFLLELGLFGAPWSRLFCNCNRDQGWKLGNKTYWPSAPGNLLTSYIDMFTIGTNDTMMIITREYFPYILCSLKGLLILTYCWCNIWMIQ